MYIDIMCPYLPDETYLKSLLVTLKQTHARLLYMPV